jgi:1,4-alpha-glucan branching enzyme
MDREHGGQSTDSPAETVRHDLTLLSEDDRFLFNEGSHFQLYEKLGAHPVTHDDEEGVYFAVWAPAAESVSVIGDFNHWDRDSHRLELQGEAGVWEGFIPGIGEGSVYKYHIRSRYRGYRVDKADPFAFGTEIPPLTASVVTRLDYDWEDEEWMAARAGSNGLQSPISIYEVHLGSWMRVPEEGNRSLSYRELAPRLGDYVEKMGFTHVELLPAMEHPFFGSWGYQITGYFAPSSRYGTPQDFMYLVDHLHRRGVGVILDWVPSHFPRDEHGLGFFDGTHLYEHEDPRKGIHPDWNTLIFNYGRHEVRSYLISNALFWLDRYHIDGLRVDAVASMLYLDYSRKEGEWIPNEHGGRENLEAISFLRRFNEVVSRNHPDVRTIAEESTAWPMVSHPTYVGGLGFDLKWDMGWMHDTLRYLARDPVYRKYHHGELTFRMMYAFSEAYVLPLSHDEVVHGKGSLISRMPGDEWQRFANLRLLYGYMFSQPGKKHLFMGSEFGQWEEWRHDGSLQWHLTDYERNAGVQRLIGDLNRVYRSTPALHVLDSSPDGFRWIDASDSDRSVLAFLRRDGAGSTVLVVCNFTPVVHRNYRIGVPAAGRWEEILNTDARHYGGSGQGNLGGVDSAPVPFHGCRYSLNLTLPPLAVLILRAPGRRPAHGRARRPESD